TVHCRILAAMRPKSVPLIAPLLLRRAGDTRFYAEQLALRRTEEQPMNVIRPEKIEAAETEVDGNFAAASEVEAGIRDFVRNDVAYLRRPGGGAQVATEPPPVPSLEPNHEAAVNNVNSLIQRVAGNSLSE